MMSRTQGFKKEVAWWDDSNILCQMWQRERNMNSSLASNISLTQIINNVIDKIQAKLLAIDDKLIGEQTFLSILNE